MWHRISTLKVYVATIAANHNTVEGRLEGMHDLVIRFFRGAWRLNLTVVLQTLQSDPFKPLQSVKLSALSMKMTLLTALTSIKKVGISKPFPLTNHAWSSGWQTLTLSWICVQGYHNFFQGSGGRSEQQKENVSVTYVNPRSLMGCVLHATTPNCL